MDFIDQYLDGLCRTCLIEIEASSYGNNTRPQWQSILDRIPECDTLRIAELLSTAVPQIQIRPSDELPKKICHECLQQLLSAYRFQQMCVQSEEQMRELVSTKHTEFQMSIMEAFKEQELETSDTDSMALETAHSTISHQYFEHSVIQKPLHEITEQMPVDETVQYSLENNKVLDVCNDEKCSFNEFIKNEPIEEDDTMHSTIPIECKQEEIRLSRDEVIEPKEEQVSAADQLESIDHLPKHCKDSQGEFSEFIKIEHIKEEDDTMHSAFAIECEEEINVAKDELIEPESAQSCAANQLVGKDQLPQHCKDSQAELSSFIKNETFDDDELSIEYSDSDIIHSSISVTKEEVLAIELEAEQVNMKLSQHRCKLCNKSFGKLEYLERHQELHKTKGDKFKNDVKRSRRCHKSKSSQGLSSDRIRRGKNIETPFKCKYCECAYSTLGALMVHLRIHLGDNIYRCGSCPLAFPSASERRLHFATHINDTRHTRKRNIKALEEHEAKLRLYISKEKTQQPSTEESEQHSKYRIRHGESRHGETRPYECPYCPLRFSSNSNMKQHKQIHEGVKREPCDICGKKIRKVHLKTHKLIHSKEKLHKCDICEKRFRNTQRLQIHSRTHTGEKPLKCKYCERAFSIHYSLNLHLRSHLGDNVFRCEFCPLAFPLASERRLHLVSHKNEDPETRERNIKALEEVEAKLRLQISKEKTQQPSTEESEQQLETQVKDVLANHRNTHVEDKAYGCTYCPLRFNSNANKWSHEKMHEEAKGATILSHKNEDPETRERNIKALREDEAELKQRISKEKIQQASTEELQQLKDRIGHNDSKPYECPYCPLRFRTKNMVHKHKEIHEGVKREPCDICGKKMRKKNLKKHKQLVHRKEKLHKCDFCEKRFANTDALRHHTNQHTGENPFKCKYCESAYSRRPALNRHLRVHLGDNIYRCEFCPLTFPSALQRSMHLVTHKNEDPETRERNIKALRDDEAKLRLHISEEKTEKLLTENSLHISTEKTQQPSTEESE